MKVICISGRAQHRKGTSANLFRKGLVNQCQGVLVTHYADLLKYIYHSFFDWDDKRDDAGRKLLQYVGTDVVYQKRPDFWISFLVNVLDLFPDEWDYVLIPDCRLPNEIEAMGNVGFDITHLRIVRLNFNSPLTMEQQRHPSETALDSYRVDYVIYNDGTASDLERKLSSWLGGEQH